MITLHELRTLSLEVQDVYIETADSSVVLVGVFHQKTLQPFYISTEKKVSIDEFDTTNKKSYKIHSITLKKIWDSKQIHTVSLSNCFVFERSLVSNNAPITHQSSFMTPISSDPEDNADWLYLLFHTYRYKKWFENMEMKPFMETNQHCTFISANGNTHMYEFVVKSQSNKNLKCSLVIHESLVLNVLQNVEHYYKLFFDKQSEEIGRKYHCLEGTDSYAHISRKLHHLNSLQKSLPKLREINFDISQHRSRSSIAFTNTKTRIIKNISDIYRTLLANLSNIETKVHCCYITMLQFESVNRELSNVGTVA